MTHTQEKEAFQSIIFETTRELINIESKIKIASIFIFCRQFDDKLFSELLYTDKHEDFVFNLNIKFENYGVDFSLNLEDKNIKNSFKKTIEKCQSKFDDNKFFKALFEKDEFALMIYKITSIFFDNSKIEELIKESTQIF